jgi:predicted methyltransferase MtxX (methanogen marker protein 4)
MKYLIGIDHTHNNRELLKAYNKLLNEDIDVELVNDPSEIIKDVVNGSVAGAIRGTMSSSKIMPKLKKEIGTFYRASILKNPFDSKNIFLLAPVGIDEIGENRNSSFKDKINIINYSIKFLKCMGMVPKIGLLSSGRLSDYGRSKRINELIDECESIVEYFKNNQNFNTNDTINDNINDDINDNINDNCNNLFNKNIHIEHKGILIEEYLKEGYNVILAPDGISGNLIFRCLGLVCGIEGYGAVILNKNNLKFIDTSRSGTWDRYYNAVKFLIKNNKLSKSNI